MKIKIALDLDGVLYDWMGSALRHFQLNPSDPLIRNVVSRYHDGLEMIKPKKEVFEAVESLGAEYWESLQLLPWAQELYRCLSEIGDVTVLTSPGAWTHAGRGKLLALRRDFQIKTFILAKKKEICAAPNAILIDDKKKNIEKFRQAGGWGYVWPNSFCIEDGKPNASQAIADCISYVKQVKTKIADRKINEIMDALVHDNGRNEDLSE